MKKCIWSLVFDGHYNISCPTGERANGNFKKHPQANYSKEPNRNFKFCPYCGREIELSDLVNFETCEYMFKVFYGVTKEGYNV